MKVTIYGVVRVVLEDGKRKIDFNNSKFYSVCHFLRFLNNRNLLLKLCKY